MIGLICYHRNAEKVYHKKWIDDFRDSVLQQTFKDFVIYEICYGTDNFRIFENSIYESKELPSFIHAMNYLIEKSLKRGVDIIGNLNVDDKYSLDRLSVQMPYMKEFDIVSSNFCLMQDDIIIKFHNFDTLNIKHELNKNHNIVGHPTVMYSRKFLESNRYIPEDFPEEDMKLWQRTINDYKFKIVPENLLFHRIHNQSVCQSGNR